MNRSERNSGPQQKSVSPKGDKTMQAQIAKLRDSINSKDADVILAVNDCVADSATMRIILGQLVGRHLAIASATGLSNAKNELDLLSRVCLVPLNPSASANGDEVNLIEVTRTKIRQFFGTLAPLAEFVDGENNSDSSESFEPDNKAAH